MGSSRLRSMPCPLADEATLLSTERWSALAAAVSSGEYLWLTDSFGLGEVLDWSSIRAPQPTTRTSRLLDTVSSARATRAVHVARIALASIAFLPRVPAGTRAMADLALAASSMMLASRQHYGSDGSDQVILVTHGACALARAVPESRADVLDALAVQGGLSYLVAGAGKLAGGSWRRGTAVADVLRTATFGHRRGANQVERAGGLSRWLTWGTIGAECLAPLAILILPRTAPFLIAALRAFHLLNAVLLGLNRFFFAFAALHPAMARAARKPTS